MRLHFTCSVDGCGGEHYAKSLCCKHYSKMRYHTVPGLREVVNARNRHRGQVLATNPNRYQKFFDRVEFTDSCWLWVGPKLPNGYGRVSWMGKLTLTHRIAYEMLVGPIPSGLTIDHLCRVRACLRPDHLEPVALYINVMRGLNPTAINKRKTHCPRGHLLTPGNLVPSVAKRGARSCLACSRINARVSPEKRRERYAAKKARRTN